MSASHHLSNAWLLSRCYTLKLLAETYVQRRCETSFSRRCNDCNDNKIVSRKKKKVSAGVAPCNMVGFVKLF